MKKIIFTFTFFFSFLNASFAVIPNFELIFKEIKATSTATESIAIREKYLYQMRNLKDFDRLTDLEQLATGEDYFDHYRRELSEFVLDNVNKFMLDRRSDVERDLFARNIVAKAYGQQIENDLLVKGLFYVSDCEDFKSYLRMAKAPAAFSSRFQSQYCAHTNPGGFGNTFELISNLVLQSGEYKVIYLPSTMFVSKLYISVEGIRTSAYFDIMVNGDIKGTIYAPGTDPLYIINVSDTTNVINLRSMGGDAHINSIKVEYK